MSNLLEAWQNAAPNEIMSPYMNSKFKKNTAEWVLQLVGSRPIDLLIQKLEINQVSADQVASCTCQFCGQLNITPDGTPDWGEDMGWDTCNNPYCGAI